MELAPQSKLLLEVGAIALGVFGLAYLLHKNSTVSAAENTAPNPGLASTDPESWNAPGYVTYNVPKALTDAYQSVPIPAAANVASGTPSASDTSTPTCGGCSSSGTGLFSSVAGLAAAYTQQLQGLEQQYAANLLAGVPTVISQFFNNPEGVEQSNTFAQSVDQWSGSGTTGLGYIRPTLQ